MGIPCCHELSVMKAMNQHHIPETLIMQRWTKNAKDVSELDSSSTVTTPDIIQLARYASMSTEGYKEANVAIDKLTIQMKGLLPSSSTAREENVHQSKMESSVQVKDPVIAATKGLASAACTTVFFPTPPVYPALLDSMSNHTPRPSNIIANSLSKALMPLGSLPCMTIRVLPTLAMTSYLPIRVIPTLGKSSCLAIRVTPTLTKTSCLLQGLPSVIM
ncbi:hypothetical protein LWI29_014908 [Acer saccharum]|uniref:Protein FAR1-RELATED SEQUENCE n=1 Tax=Acer saccharum TaxID=4024 RepID=A0AA39TC58_ACESA|nr:hypothetical protein LWI29_014908 [Acer saccharum]